VTQDRESDKGVAEHERDAARAQIYSALNLYIRFESKSALGPQFPDLARSFFEDPAAALDHIASTRALEATDAQADEMLAKAMAEMPPPLRRRVLLAYLGFPFYDTVTLPLLRGEGMTEFDPVQVDRISPDDCNAIRRGGASETLRGTEFFNFGAFFSRSYRENDYLWGRLHGAERLLDLIASTLDDDHAIPERELNQFRREAFLEILDEEKARLRADPGLIERIRKEVMAT
jgi:hypothetical protein